MHMNATDFECPVCGAKVGERCHTFTGKVLPVTHARRKWEAVNFATDEEEDVTHPERLKELANKS